MQLYADVIVDISVSRLDKTFQYSIPDDMKGQVRVGTPVNIPFGNRSVSGFVVGISTEPEFDPEKIKAITSVAEKAVALEGQMIQLAAWMKETYGCTMNQALKTVLPSRRKVKSRKPRVEQTDLSMEERDTPPPLNEEQMRAADGVWQIMHSQDPVPSLIFGVTGSGKTEVYMELIARTIAEGKQAILLIPEISLTFQNLRRFYRRFGDRIATINSRLSAGEKYDSFDKARRGAVDLMIGPRSALFAPFQKLGLIIVDEEHEGAYHSETSPRFSAVETAVKRGQLAGAGVVLGSATPDMKTFAAAMDRKIAIFPIRHRASSGSHLPEVSIVDLREELLAGNKSIFSRELTEKMEEALQRGEQIMLFLNRRGYSGFISCRSCGKAIKCPHCDVSLTSHFGHKLVCHYCGYTIPEPTACPSCGSPYIAGFGMGTQKVETMTKKLFPGARTLRMDLDTTGKKDGHAKILKAFAEGKADILIGTQMIVKGHDFPKVTVVGILAADLSLYSPDYRAAERTFQLLTQAAGRAGRGDRPGKVVIQTYSPDHYVIETASRQDYIGFYKQELACRRLLGYPPAGEMMSMLITDGREETAQACAEKIARGIRHEFALEEAVVIGPADAGIGKIQDIYRKQLFVKHSDRQVLMDIRDFAEKEAICSLQIDIL